MHRLSQSLYIRVLPHCPFFRQVRATPRRQRWGIRNGPALKSEDAAARLLPPWPMLNLATVELRHSSISRQTKRTNCSLELSGYLAFCSQLYDNQWLLQTCKCCLHWWFKTVRWGCSSACFLQYLWGTPIIPAGSSSHQPMLWVAVDRNLIGEMRGCSFSDFVCTKLNISNNTRSRA